MAPAGSLRVPCSQRYIPNAPRIRRPSQSMQTTALPFGPTAFVGRERELAVLCAHLAAAGRGEGRVVLVAGEAGIGKTRLLRELAGRARAAGWRVLGGAATETEGATPYLP